MLLSYIQLPVVGFGAAAVAGAEVVGVGAVAVACADITT